MRIALNPDRPGLRPGTPGSKRPSRPRGFVLLWLAALLLPAFGVIGTGLTTWRDVRREAEARLERNAEMLRQHALRAFATQEAILAAIGRASTGRDWEAMRQDAQLHGLLAELTAAGQPVVRGVLVADDQDRVVSASYEFPARPTDLSDRSYLRELRAGAGQTVGEVLVSRPMGWPAFGIARSAPPRPGAEGPRGTLVTSFNPDALASFYASVVEGPQDVVSLVRLDGAILARHPKLPPDAPTGPRPEAEAQIAHALALPRGAPLPAVASRFDGMKRLFVAKRVGEWPVAILYGLEQRALVAAWQRRMAAPLASGLAAAGLLLLLTAIAARGAREQQLAAERRTEAEARLAGASRAAAIGLLAAGLAHDVKNLVQAVRSGTRLMESRAEDPAEVRRCAGLLAASAERGRQLVDGMLAFAHGGAEPEATDLDVAPALRELAELLNRTLGSGWQVKAEIPDALPRARGDRAGFEAAVVNLAANARDAMPRGGRVDISAWVATVPEAPDGEDLQPGSYVVAAVRDRGIGMDAATLARIGEPFFTTKGAGLGTGLGLASVRGFCERAGGVLRVDSEPGRGTTATIWLPTVG
ncbi:ATP-binding protein [Falsiroseomonas sp. HC035]|uniref:ATP-binding protein n=1 Tax=Falsiroseomonas sp. HC035 TaxID=3390999 RepID=UPI003D3168A6